ncbi:MULTISPECIES: hypothetical protein [Aeromonas]|uniref:hypothetical protein n=1 Tax=Aeromonas TaxID=642 RepID=UPI0013E2DAEB|nr:MULTISPECIES: hypothetical protein [Aeromonas]MCK0187669.1 hypothetical protein [Aeromonas hydrophila]MDX7641926.1 hypothetical protein [Aeromonas caviae]MDX7801828.1 hypothetical protein [Aeromonas caviae]MEA9423649.1 hypothetical protein [Aeromonas caviae]MEA9427053.1 hypothetical protein [Aeromonas caviae]
MAEQHLALPPCKAVSQSPEWALVLRWPAKGKVGEDSHVIKPFSLLAPAHEIFEGVFRLFSRGDFAHWCDPNFSGVTLKVFFRHEKA